jgi:hypothetical protein
MKVEQWFCWQNPEIYPECIQWSNEARTYVVQTEHGPQAVPDGAFIVTDDTENDRLTTFLHRAMWALHQVDPEAAAKIEQDMIAWVAS